MCRDISAKTSVQRAGCSGPARRGAGVGLRAACSSLALTFHPAARAGMCARALQQHVPTRGPILSIRQCGWRKEKGCRQSGCTQSKFLHVTRMTCDDALLHCNTLTFIYNNKNKREMFSLPED